jgi:hypothetical protein
VCLLPDRPETEAGVASLAERVGRTGGGARVFPIGRLPADDEQAVVAAFSAERSVEYDEVVAHTRAFLGELAIERDGRRPTYAEFELSHAELKRLQGWLRSIRGRDWFDAPGYAEARDGVAECERRLAEFEAEAFAVEVHPTDEDVALAPWRLRLRGVGGPPARP